MLGFCSVKNRAVLSPSHPWDALPALVRCLERGRPFGARSSAPIDVFPEVQP